MFLAIWTDLHMFKKVGKLDWTEMFYYWNKDFIDRTSTFQTIQH